VRSVELAPAAPDAKTVRDGLAFALKHAEPPPEWIAPQARSGPAAWATWAEALETGEAADADAEGLTYLRQIVDAL